MVDVKAKAASERPEEPILINYSDRPSVVKDALRRMWKQRWERCRDKLREIKPEPEMWIDIGKYFHRDKVVISRMRLEYTLLAQGCLMDSDVPDVAPRCELCNNALLSVLLP